MEDFDQDKMMKDFEKEMKKKEGKKDQKVEVTGLDEDDMKKLQDATHDKHMLADKDGEIHRVAEIDFIIKDILKHQDKAFKLPRSHELQKIETEVDIGDENTTLEKKDFKFAENENSALEYLNEDIISIQRGILVYLARKIGVNLLTGKSVMNVSLPIKIFEPRSMLEKVASDMRFIPYFLKKAMEDKEPIERMKTIVTCYICGLQLEPQMLKPFNPILGETFQGMIGEYEIAIEQISHHPPITAFQMWSDSLENSPVVDGYLAFEASTGISTISGSKTGCINITFPDTSQKVVLHTFPE
jgi:hypothetical protein